MKDVDTQYLDLVEKIIKHGVGIKIKNTVRRTIFGYTFDLMLDDGFPMLTTKKVWWKGVKEELIWFLNGSTNVKELEEKGVYIWSQNSLPNGTIGDAYGKQWRNWNGIDQINNCIQLLKKYPKSTRNVVVAWNPQKINNMALPPCHFSFQCLSENGKDLTLCVTMRSVDVALGLPFNIASYGLLTHLLAKVSDLNPHRLIMQLSHCHIYQEHIDAIEEMFFRPIYSLPDLELKNITSDLKNLDAKQIILKNYFCGQPIKMEMVKT